MKSPPDVAVYEAKLVAEITAWNALEQIDRAALSMCRKELKAMLAASHRRSVACHALAQKCRIYRNFISCAEWNSYQAAHKLANLDCDEPLPF
ncbi:hypothetical protein [Aeromonas veronii]|nr:hypothetical protein [Aeromonas veronii]